MRTDYVLDNVRVHLPNASTIGFGKFYAKRGNWLTFRHSGGMAHGRSLGRVTCDRQTYVFVIALHGELDNPCVRWVKPEDVTACLEKPPKSIFEFICSDFSKPADVIARVEQGFLSDSYERPV